MLLDSIYIQNIIGINCHTDRKLCIDLATLFKEFLGCQAVAPDYYILCDNLSRWHRKTINFGTVVAYNTIKIFTLSDKSTSECPTQKFHKCTSTQCTQRRLAMRHQMSPMCHVHQYKMYRNIWQVLITHSCASRKMPLGKNSVSLDKSTFQPRSTPA